MLLCLSAVSSLQAQQTTADKPAPRAETTTPEVHFPLFNGITVGVDLWGLGSSLLGGDFMSTEVAVDVNLKNRLFPIVEIGYGSTDTWNDNGTHYESSAPYFRLGLNYNILFKKSFKNYLFIGARYGFSSFKYDVNALSVNDPIWNEEVPNPNQSDPIWGGSVSYHHNGMKASMHWMELYFGLRAHIWKELYMGWSVRMKYRMSSSADPYGDPWYVPGYGKYLSNTMGVTYTITYLLPFK
jgi:hypothetical protein